MMCAARVAKPASARTEVPRALRQWASHKRSLSARAVTKKYASFEDMLQNSPIPVLVDFYATWCGPCVLMADVLEDVAPKIKGKMAVVKINTEKYSNLAAKYSVQELPTLGVFKDGELVQRISGLHSSEQLLYVLSPYLMDPAEA